MPRRKTKDVLRQERADAERRYQDSFLLRLSRISTAGEAIRLSIDAPRQGEVGKALHSNPAFFLQECRTPSGPSNVEVDHYTRLVERLRANGEWS